MSTSGSSKGEAGVEVCPVPGLELPSPGSGGADLGAVPVAEMMDNLKSYTPRCEIKDPRNNINQY